MDMRHIHHLEQGSHSIESPLCSSCWRGTRRMALPDMLLPLTERFDPQGSFDIWRPL